MLRVLTRRSRFTLHFVILGAAVSACNSTSATAPQPLPPAPILPTAATFSLTRSMSPTASANAASIDVPLPPSSGYSGQAVLPANAVPSGLTLTVTYANRPPTGVAPLDLTRAAATERAPLELISTDVVYACVAANQSITIGGQPQYTFMLPASYADPRVRYFAAIRQGAAWVDGYAGPAAVTSTAGSANVSLKGRFGFTLAPNAPVCVALFGRWITTATPTPATAPSSTPTSAPSATPSPSPSPSASPSQSPSPSPSPTATPNLVASAASLAFTTAASQTLTLSQAGYTGLVTQSNTCSGIATITATHASGPAAVFSVSPVAAGSCAATFTGSGGRTAIVTIGVTTAAFSVQ